MSTEDGQADVSGHAVLRLEFFDHLNGELALGERLGELAERAREALPACVANPAPADSGSPAVLGELPLIEISIISDEAIAAVHADFMNDPTPTDVITFHHGEILISADTARVRAAELGQPMLRELLLYVIHGLLHLNGHEDYGEAERGLMHEIQDEILQSVWPLAGGTQQTSQDEAGVGSSAGDAEGTGI